MHCMSNKTFLQHMKKVSEAIVDAALQSMLDAAEEEKAIAIRDRNVDSDGVPMCTVVADGAWCRRSYKTNYDSISGVASIVGFKREKVLYIGVRNRYCSICASCQNAKQTPPRHTCFLDWKKSATSMEADITVGGFLQSEKLLGLKFNKLIGEILTCHKLTDLIKNTKFPVTSRNLLKQQIPIFRTAVDKALNTRICMLKADHCDVYFCNGNKEGEINHVPELKSRGLLQEIMKIICGSVSRHVSSLIADQNTNLSELFTSIVNKHVAGKRIIMLLEDSTKGVVLLQYQSTMWVNI
ncbi:hypothetical protein PR048_001390 [Dryococelus australis]|uniref:Mutator-like transposase domain-containing protein n=1 Tax=Dryococelus australis TaxID=614101 RepID=A0ABQ9IIL3_9NEOP|nr:hypothetical protein PR048_001390 [Dryococelus australis]